MTFIGAGPRIEEWVFGQAVEQRSLFHDLEDGVLDRRCMRVRQWVEVQAHNRHAIRELFYKQQLLSRVQGNEGACLPTYFLAEYKE